MQRRSLKKATPKGAPKPKAAPADPAKPESKARPRRGRLLRGDEEETAEPASSTKPPAKKVKGGKAKKRNAKQQLIYVGAGELCKI